MGEESPPNCGAAARFDLSLDTRGRPMAQTGSETPIAATAHTNGLPYSRLPRSIQPTRREGAWVIGISSRRAGFAL
jgi:hypothetical protein